MDDLGRWLRYAAPGSLAVSLVGLWVLLDLRFDSANQLGVTFQDPAFAAVVGAASTIPVGFVASVVAAQLVWNPPALRLWVRPLPDPEIAQKCRRTLTRLVPGARIDGPLVPRTEASIVINVALQRLKADPKNRPAADRVERLLDLNNGLANGATSAFGAVPAILIGSALAQAWTDERWPGILISIATALTVGWFCAVGQHRVTQLAERWLCLLLSDPFSESTTHG